MNSPGLIVSAVVTFGGLFLALLGFKRRQDVPFVVGAWLVLSGLCLMTGFSYSPFWPYFIGALVTIAVLALGVGIVGRGRTLVAFALLWAWFWFAALQAYSRAGWLGVILIGLPTYVVPIYLVTRASRHLLPLANEGQRGKALRAFLTWLFGTNHPFYLIHSDEWGDRKVERVNRMGGSPFVPLMAGPGVVISRCDHLPVISDGVKFKGAKPPGASFTTFADSVPQAIDLRPQLRAFDVDARTKDGIGIKVLAFTPFRLDCGNETARLGKPFPFRVKSVFRAVHKAQLIEHSGMGQIPERTRALMWDDLSQVLTSRILRDIIAQYRFDDLCAPFRLTEDPRVEIAERFKKRLRAELKPCGIHLIGGGLSNLLPAEESRRQIFEQRIQSWQAHWVRHVMEQQAKGQRSRLRQIEKARAQAQVEAIQAVSERLARLEEGAAAVSSEEVFTLFIDVISQMAVRPLVRRLLPETVVQSVQTMSRSEGRSS
jgi:hypothetical protein